MSVVADDFGVIAGLVVLIFGPTLIAFEPWSWRNIPKADRCARCKYSRDGLSAQAACPECGEPFVPIADLIKDTKQEHYSQIHRALMMIALCALAMVVIWHLVHLGIALSYVLDGFRFSTGWKAAPLREMNGRWVAWLVWTTVPPLQILALHKNFRQTLIVMGVIVVLVAVSGSIYGAYFAIPS